MSTNKSQFMHKMNTQQPTIFTQAQLELLDMMSHVKSQDTLKELRQVIAQFFAKKIETEIDGMWESGLLNEQKIEEFRNLHERTPYKQ